MVRHTFGSRMANYVLGNNMADNSALAAAADESITAEAPVDGPRRRASGGRLLAGIASSPAGPNGALGAGEHQWILYRAKIAESGALKEFCGDDWPPVRSSLRWNQARRQPPAAGHGAGRMSLPRCVSSHR